MARPLCAANFACAASAVHTTRTSLFTNHVGIHFTTRAAARARPTHSCSLPRASSQGLRRVFSEGPEFGPLYDDSPSYGPPAMILIGLSYSEILKIQQLLKEVQAESLKVLVCTNEMIKGTVWNAMHTSQPGPTRVKGVQGVPRMCIFSGLIDDEITLLVMTFLDADMELTFKVMIPNNAQKTLEELLWEHERKFSNGEGAL